MKKTIDTNRYFLGIMGHMNEVTKEEFMGAEKGSGFYSKFPGSPATGGFGSSNGVSGSVRKAYMLDEAGEYLPEFDFQSPGYIESQDERIKLMRQKEKEFLEKHRAEDEDAVISTGPLGQLKKLS